MELAIVILNLAIMYIFRTEVDAASRREEVIVATGLGIYSSEAGLPTFGSKHAESKGPERNGIFPESTRHQVSHSNVPRRLSIRSPPGADGYTPVSGSHEEDDDSQATENGYSGSPTEPLSDPGSPPPRRPSLPLNDSLSGRSGSEASSGSCGSVLSVVSNSSVASQRECRANTDSSTGDSPTVTVSSANSLSMSELLLEDAKAFAAKAAAYKAASGTRPGEEGFVKHTYADSRICKAAVHFGGAKLAGDIGGVSSVIEVKVDNLSNNIIVAFEERRTVRGSSGWKKKSTVFVRKAMGIAKTKVRRVSMGLPEGCYADQSARYFIFFMDKTRLSDPNLVESLVIILDKMPKPFRVPRSLNVEGWTENSSSPPNRWIKQKCSFSLAFSRYLLHVPVLRIDRVKGKAFFENEELRDLSVFLAERNKDSEETPCDWTSPFLCKIIILFDPAKAPHEWVVKLDLSPSTGGQSFIQEVKLANGEDVGIPAGIPSGRAERTHDG